MATLEDCDAAARTTLRDGGGTFYRDDLSMYNVPAGIAGGFAVGLCPGTAVTCETTIDEISDAIGTVLHTWPDAPFVGTWTEDALVHADPVVILPHRRDAKLLGRALGQKSIWSFATKEEILL